MSLVVKHQLINALLDLNHSGSMYFLVSTLSSSMHFWVFISSHRCTLPSFLKLSMHFWVSEWHHRCTSGFKVHSSMYFWGADVVGRCTLWIQVDFIDALLGFHRNSSMHFWVFSSTHRCTFGFSPQFIDALCFSWQLSSMYMGARGALMNASSLWQPLLTYVDDMAERPSGTFMIGSACLRCLPSSGLACWRSGALWALMMKPDLKTGINVSGGSRCIDPRGSGVVLLMKSK